MNGHGCIHQEWKEKYCSSKMLNSDRLGEFACKNIEKTYFSNVVHYLLGYEPLMNPYNEVVEKWIVVGE